MTNRVVIIDKQGRVGDFLGEMRAQGIAFLFSDRRHKVRATSRLMVQLHSSKLLFEISLLIRSRDVSLVRLMQHGAISVRVK
jgi:hypothetical protein